MTAIAKPSITEIRQWLSEVPDPEIPVISLTDLGIIRDVTWDDETLVVTVTPTYSGCPATSIINLDIEAALRQRGIDRLRLERSLSPPWTTDWISAEGRRRLAEYGIAPPGMVDKDAAVPIRFFGRGMNTAALECPRCGSMQTERLSAFGATACKALYRCLACREPFEHFKPI